MADGRPYRRQEVNDDIEYDCPPRLYEWTLETLRNRSNELPPGFVAPDTTTLSTDANGVMSAVTAWNDDFNAYLGI